ncbi:hypothetical protein ES703_84774 [subsurface metagenome]
MVAGRTGDKVLWLGRVIVRHISPEHKNPPVIVCHQPALVTFEQYALEELFTVEDLGGHARFLFAVIPVHFYGRPPVVCGVVPFGHQPLWTSVGIDGRSACLAGRRKSQVKCPIRHVYHVAAHISDLSAAEVPEAVPTQAPAGEVLGIVRMER